MNNIDTSTIVLIVVAIVTIIIAFKAIRVVSQSQAVVVERLGKYSGTLTAGLNFIVPFLDKEKDVYHVNIQTDIPRTRVDLREQNLNLPKQEVRTKENIAVEVDSVIFYQITEPVKVIYEISKPIEGIAQISQTTMRNIFGEMDIDTTLGARNVINNRLREVLDEATDKWGIKVKRVEVQEITPPLDVKKDLQKIIVADRAKKAEVISAEAIKQKEILHAEGERKSQILRAEGEAQAVVLAADADKQKQILEAEGESESIRLVKAATAKGLDEIRTVLAKTDGSTSVVLIEALNAQMNVAKSLAEGKNEKFFLPNDLAGLFGAIGSVKEILKTKSQLESQSS